MPYVARTHQLKQSLLYHIYNRGLNRDRIFHKPEDYLYFIKLLTDYSKKYNFKVYHWVIMSNHYHLLAALDQPEIISSVMSGLARAYSCYHHREHKTAGYLWQGRFKSQPIEQELYLSACGRYIERNPIKALIVSDAWEYDYSSARFYTSGRADGLTVESPLFETFANTPEKRIQNYKEYLQAFNKEEDSYFENLERPRGSIEFIKRLYKEKGHFFPRRQGRTHNN
jgi:putative transposase